MRFEVKSFVIIAGLVILVASAIGLLLALGGVGDSNEFGSPVAAGTSRARLEELVEEGAVTLGGERQVYQQWRITVLEGQHQGESMLMEYGRQQPTTELDTGQEILVTISPGLGGEPTASFADFIRTRELALLAGLFVLFILAVSRWKGLRALIGMAVSFVVILQFILPQILAGRDPVLISIIGSLGLLASTLYLVYGWSWKTHTAVAGTLLALIITGLLAAFSVNFTHLTGTGSEESLFLQQFLGRPINLRGLLLGAMIIGALGVLDDLTISQVSAVFELKRANPALSFRDLYQRAMIIGQDHVAATVNTLVLAYVGASLPMFLLFSLLAEPLELAVNHSFVAEEIVRTLVGSLGLISAVPITTGLASLAATQRVKLRQFGRWFGPIPGEESGGHVH
ncbi:MAG: YibE/F family protein [Anaerolineales bacterium]